jgi:hypothetical protein
MTEELFESWGIEEFLMPFAQRHVRFKIPSPLGQGGDFRGVLETEANPPRRCAPPLRRRGFSKEKVAKNGQSKTLYRSS